MPRSSRRGLRREEPAQARLLGLGAVDQCDARFRELDSRVRQATDDSGKIFFVTDKEESFAGMPRLQAPQHREVEAGLEALLFPAFHAEMFSRDRRGLPCAHERTGQDQIGRDL